MQHVFITTPSGSGAVKTAKAVGRPFAVPSYADNINHHPPIDDTHVVAVIPDNFVDDKAWSGRDIGVRWLPVYGKRNWRVVSVGAVVGQTWLEENRKRIVRTFRDQRLNLTQAAQVHQLQNAGVYQFSGMWLTGFYNSMVRMFDDASFTDDERQVLVDAAISVDDGAAQWADHPSWYESYVEAWLAGSADNVREINAAMKDECVAVRKPELVAVLSIGGRPTQNTVKQNGTGAKQIIALGYTPMYTGVADQFKVRTRWL